MEPGRRTPTVCAAFSSGVETHKVRHTHTKPEAEAEAETDADAEAEVGAEAEAEAERQRWSITFCGGAEIGTQTDHTETRAAIAPKQTGEFLVHLGGAPAPSGAGHAVQHHPHNIRRVAQVEGWRLEISRHELLDPIVGTEHAVPFLPDVILFGTASERFGLSGGRRGVAALGHPLQKQLSQGSARVFGVVRPIDQFLLNPFRASAMFQRRHFHCGEFFSQLGMRQRRAAFSPTHLRDAHRDEQHQQQC